MATNKSSVLLNCLVPSCSNCDLDIITWKKRREDNETFPCPRHVDAQCQCNEPYAMFSFPKDDMRLKSLWIDLCQRPKDFQVRPWHGICSIHFMNENFSEELPFPFLKMGLQKWQIVQTMKAYFPSEQFVSLKSLLNEQFGQMEHTRPVTSKLKSVTIDLNQARNVLNKRNCDVVSNTALRSEINSDVETTLLNIPKLSEPVKIKVSTSLRPAQPTDGSLQMNCQNKTEINSVVPGIRIFNTAPTNGITVKFAPPKPDIPLLPVEIVEQELVVDESGSGSNPLTYRSERKRHTLGRPSFGVNGNNLEDFLHHPDTISKRPYRKKDAISCLLTKECIDNHDMYQSLIDELKTLTKNINELNERKRKFMSANFTASDLGSTVLVPIHECEQCAMLQKAYRNSLHQSRQLEAQVSSTQLMQNDLLRRLATKGSKKFSMAAIKQRLTVARNIERNKYDRASSKRGVSHY